MELPNILAGMEHPRRVPEHRQFAKGIVPLRARTNVLEAQTWLGYNSLL